MRKIPIGMLITSFIIVSCSTNVQTTEIKKLTVKSFPSSAESIDMSKVSSPDSGNKQKGASYNFDKQINDLPNFDILQPDDLVSVPGAITVIYKNM